MRFFERDWRLRDLADDCRIRQFRSVSGHDTLAEIEEALPKLTNEELMHVEALLHSTQRQRGVGIIFDDSYGVWTEDDQTSVAAEAWAVLDADRKKP